MANTKASDHPESSDAGRKAKADAEKADSKVADQVQQAVDQDTDQGYRGVKVDPTPNEAYTLEGQAKGAATPETDADAAAKAGNANRFAGNE